MHEIFRPFTWCLSFPRTLICSSPCFSFFFSVNSETMGSFESSNNTSYSWPYALSSVASKICQIQRIMALELLQSSPCPTTPFSREGAETHRERESPNQHDKSMAESGNPAPSAMCFPAARLTSSLHLLQM